LYDEDFIVVAVDNTFHHKIIRLDDIVFFYVSGNNIYKRFSVANGFSLAYTADFFKFSISYWEELFKSVDHPTICIAPNLYEATTDMLKEKDIIIVVDTDKDTVSNTMEKVRVNDGQWDDGYGSAYEARVVIGTYAKMDSKPGQFEGVRWARHGNGFGKYWTQERNNASCEFMPQANGIGYNSLSPGCHRGCLCED
jgi:hypothetical protein